MKCQDCTYHMHRVNWPQTVKVEYNGNEKLGRVVARRETRSGKANQLFVLWGEEQNPADGWISEMLVQKVG